MKKRKPHAEKKKRIMSAYHPYGGRKKQIRARVALAVVLALLLCFTALEGLVLVRGRDHLPEGHEPGAMIILGCQVRQDGPSVLLRDRLDKALAYLEEHPDLLVVLSGAQGENEPVSEAQCMYDYLTGHGVSPDRLLLEESSFNTNENIRRSIETLAAAGYDTTADTVIVSNEFHLARTRMLWKRAAGTDENLSLLAAPSTHRPTYLRMLVREPLALVKSWLLDRR